MELTSAAVFWNSATAEPCSGQLLAPAQRDILLQPVEEGWMEGGEERGIDNLDFSDVCMCVCVCVYVCVYVCVCVCVCVSVCV